MKTGYLQFELHEGSRHLTAFITDEGLYQFRRVPFGLSSAAGFFDFHGFRISGIGIQTIAGRPAGLWHPIAYSSRSLTPAEYNYSVGEKEALAVVWLVEKWHLFTYGRPVTVFTDHSTLSTLLTAGSQGVRPLCILLWTERLRAYPLVNIRYARGSDNTVADLLPRQHPNTHSGNEQDSNADEFEVDPDDSTRTDSQPQRSPRRDHEGHDLTNRHALQGGMARRKAAAPELQEFHRARDELYLWGDGCIARGPATVIPAELRHRVISMAHEGHHGIVRSKQQCRTAAWWPGISKDIETAVRNCMACAQAGESTRPSVPPMIITSTPAAAWEDLQLDICGEFKRAPRHQRFAIVLVDKFSRWPEVALEETVTTKSIINFLEIIWTRWGTPKSITTDNGPQFGRKFDDYVDGRAVEHKRTAVYCPEQNGNVERFNKTLGEGIDAHLTAG
ncbi:hypothetical protein BOX15_Mlig033351g1 [Macrostomum lignano]|uniref:Integrase catalytic domain-containing protein n=1 Tax=Macrostomum lignano TaxID=282301 RepID=A0A267GMP9_9PLAT|nr:hypothetical protein BOX15_Mlig033351g1 [Macrostomum lignano]